MKVERRALLWAASLLVACGPREPAATGATACGPRLPLEQLARLPQTLAPGTPAARARQLLGDGADGVWLRERCFVKTVVADRGVVRRLWLESAVDDDARPEGLDEATYQSYRGAARAMIEALEGQLGAPTQRRSGPTHLPPADELIGAPEPEPLCAAWRANGTDVAVSLRVSVGKGVRDLRLVYEHKPAAESWDWGGC